MISIIKIIAIPSGEAPLWVRKAWVGLELPVGIIGISMTKQCGVLNGLPDPENLDGFTVATKIALFHLEKVNPVAAKWWKNHYNGEHLVFGKKFCQIII